MHAELKPLHLAAAASSEPRRSAEVANSEDIDGGDDSDNETEDESEGLDMVYQLHNGVNSTFDEQLKHRIHVLTEFTTGLQYQLQFRDLRFLQALDREGRSLFRMAENCLQRERRQNSTRGDPTATWESSSTMFYRTRPSLGNQGS